MVIHTPICCIVAKMYLHVRAADRDLVPFRTALTSPQCTAHWPTIHRTHCCLCCRIHDTSSDNKLDGLELLAAIAHGLDDEYDKIADLDIDDEKKNWKRKVLSNKAWSKCSATRPGVSAQQQGLV